MIRTALIRAALICALAILAACGEGPGTSATGAQTREITLALWAGRAGALDGPVRAIHPVTGAQIDTYRRRRGGNEQVLAVTQDGAALGRITERRPGMPELHFTGDAVFPLGLWREGERRAFVAREFTLLGPAERRITLEILDLSFDHDGAPGSLRFRVLTRDAADRPISCATSVYSPGQGLVASEVSTLWRGGAVC